jgi:hypothetical protein
MPEGAITSRVLKELRARGVAAFKHFSGAYSSRGISDIIGVLPPHGRAFFIEMKTPEAYKTACNGATAHQVEFLREMRAAGAIAFCASSWEMVRETLGLP